MIPADLGAELARAVTAAITAGELPPAAGSVTQAGTWRPAGPGGYASALPFSLAAVTTDPPAAIAQRLAPRLAAVTWIASAQATGEGYLTVTVTEATLANLIPRITAAGPACARSDALRGTTRAAPPLPDLSAAPDWRTACRDQAAALAGRLAEAAGAATGPRQDSELLPSATRHHDTDSGSVAGAVAFMGADAVRYALSRIPQDRAGADAARYAQAVDLARRADMSAAAPPERAGRLAPGEREPQQTQVRCRSGDSKGESAVAAVRGGGSAGGGAGDGGSAESGACGAVVGTDGRVGEVRAATALRAAADPFYTVIQAHAAAASVRRWAADLGLAAGEWPGVPPRYEPAELALLTRLSWLPERVAAAARRDRPAELPRYLEALAADWRECREECPALPFGGRAAPADTAGTGARLWLADAVRVVLAAGLELIGVTARDRQ